MTGIGAIASPVLAELDVNDSFPRLVDRVQVD